MRSSRRSFKFSVCIIIKFLGGLSDSPVIQRKNLVLAWYFSEKNSAKKYQATIQVQYKYNTSRIQVHAKWAVQYKLKFHVVGHFGEHDVVGGTRVNDEVVTEEDLEEIGAGETIVLPLCVQGFPFSHAFVAHEDDVGVVHGNVDALVAEFPEKAAVTEIDLRGDSAEVPDGVVEGVAVDMIDSAAFGNRSDESEVLKAGKEHITIRAC